MGNYKKIKCAIYFFMFLYYYRYIFLILYTFFKFLINKINNKKKVKIYFLINY